MLIVPTFITLRRAKAEWHSYWSADWPRWLHAAKTAIAMVIAMGVCMRLNLAPPRTAMVSVVILMMHQHVGMVIARGFYRGIGMLVGCLAGFMLVANFPQQPLPFFLGLAAWIGVCVLGAAYYRNYQSYGFVLAGYATAIVAVPAWANPYGVFDSIVHTASEVVVGVVIAGLVSALIFPLHVRDALLALGQRHAGTFLAFIGGTLRRHTTPSDSDALHVRLIGERAQIEHLRSAAVFEDPALRLGNPLMARLNHDFLDTAAGFHSVRQVHVRALRLADPQTLDAVETLFAELLALLPAEDGPGQPGLDQIRELRDRLRTLLPSLPKHIQQLRAGLHATTEEARDTFSAAASVLYFATADLESYLDSFIAVRDRPANPPMSVRGKFHARSIASTANRMAAIAAGVRAAVAVLLMAAAWVASGWTGGATAVIAVAITCALFAVMPQPAAASRKILFGCLAGWATAFAFDAFVLPRIDGFALLAVCIAPVIIAGSYINTFPRVAVFGLGFNIYFCFISNITNPHQYDPIGVLDTGLAMLAGIAMATLAFSIIVPYAGPWVTARYLRQLQRLVPTLAVAAPLQPGLLLRFESNMRDFIIQALARPVDGAIGRRNLLDWAFAALEIGRAILQVRQDSSAHRATLPTIWPAAQCAWQQAMAAVFESPSGAHHAQALAATHAALAALPAPDVFEDAPQVLARFRIRALLHATALSLMDPSLPFHPQREHR